MDRIVFARCGRQPEKNTFISHALRDVLEITSSTQHEVNGFDEEGLTSIAGSPKNVQPGREREFRGLLSLDQEIG